MFVGMFYDTNNKKPCFKNEIKEWKQSDHKI